MDTLTHILFTYIILMLFYNWLKFPRSYVMPILLGSVLPDWDYLFSLFKVSIVGFSHRGIGHSLILSLIPCFILGSILASKRIKKQFWSYTVMPWWVISLLIWVGYVIHILSDLMLPTTIMLFYPISFREFQPSNISTHLVYSVIIAFFFAGILIQLFFSGSDTIPKTERYPYTRTAKILSVISIILATIINSVWFFYTQTVFAILVSMVFSSLVLGVITITILRSDMKIGK